jgi:N-acetylneuraminic acid mutarotase
MRLLETLFSLSLLSTSLARQAGKCWSELEPLQVGLRQEHGVTVAGTGANTTIYAIGGLVRITDSLEPSGSVEAYNVANNTWRNVAMLPTPMHHPNVATYNGKIYVLGGVVGYYPWNGTADSFEYDPSKNEWKKLAPLPRERGSAAMGVWNGTIWLAGGLIGLLQAVNIVDSYDIEKNEWTSWPSLQLPWFRDHAGGAVVDNTFYVIGGRDGQIQNTENKTLALDLNALTGWVKKADLPVPRGGASVTVMGKKIYVMGGEGNPAAVSGVFPNVDVYDTEKDVWSSEGNMTLPVHGTGAVTVGEKIYIPAGSLTFSAGQTTQMMQVYGPGNCSISSTRRRL